MSRKSLRWRDIRRMSQQEKLEILAELKKRRSELDQTWKYLNLNELDEKERITYAEGFGERLALHVKILEIERHLGIVRGSAKARDRARENRRMREEFEAREKERIRNLPPIDQEQLERVQETMRAYLEYREREKRLKRTAY